MKLAKIITCLTLSLLMLLTCVLSGCGKDNAEQTTTTLSSTDSSSSAPEIPPEPADDELTLSKQLSFNGQTLNMMIRSEYVSEFFAEALTGDALNDAAFYRDSSIEEELGISINYIPVKQGSSNEDYNQTIRNAVLSNTNEFDLVASYAYYTAALTSEDLFVNWLDVDNIDLSRVWWGSRSHMSDLLTINDKLYLITGDASLLYTQKAFALFFNKNVLENATGTKDTELYDLVNTGKWTLDKFMEYSTSISHDLDGNGVMDNADRYGFTTYLKTCVDNFFCCLDIPIVGKDGSGQLTIAINTPHTIDAVAKLSDLFYKDNRTFLTDSKGNAVKLFTSDLAAFTVGGLEWYPSFKDMTSDYGVLPCPKYDEDQESYSTSVSDTYSVFGMPKTCGKTDMVGAALELYGYHNYNDVTTVYFDNVLKGKSARDSESYQMLDVVHNSISFDLGFFYSSALGNPAHMFRTLLKDASAANFSSYWDANGTVFQTNLEKLLNAHK